MRLTRSRCSAALRGYWGERDRLPARAVDFPNQIVASTVNALPNTVAGSVTRDVRHTLPASSRGDEKITSKLAKSAT